MAIIAGSHANGNVTSEVTNCIGADGAKGAPLKVAIYNDDGVSSGGPVNLALCLADPEKFAFTEVNGASIREGVLNNFDVAIFPGGSGSGQAESLMEQGRDSVRAFVARGGGYLGVCAGAYLVTSHYSWSLNILNAKVLDTSHWDRGRGTVEVGFSDAGRRFFNLPEETVNIEYMQGPLLAPAGIDSIPGYIEIGKFNTEIALNGAPAYVMTGSTAAAASCYKKGRVFAMSPHPEVTDSLRWMIATIVEWLGGDDDFATITSPMYNEEWQVGSSHKIGWVSYGGTDEMKIEYSVDNRVTWFSVSPGSGSGFEWTIPDTPAEGAVIRISSNNRTGIADSIHVDIIPAIKLIRSLSSGNWSDPATWAGGVVPTQADDVMIDAGHVVTVDAAGSCRNLSFGNADSKLGLNADLSIYGDFMRFDTSVNPFYTTQSLWTAGARIVFRGDRLVQRIGNLGTTSTNPYPLRFDHVAIDKSAGKVVTDGEANAKISLGNRLEIINGMFELTATHDIEGRRVPGDTTHTAFYIYPNGWFRMQGGTSHMRAGNFIGANSGKLGRMIVQGKATLSPGSTNRTSFEGIDIEDGGFVEVPVNFGVAANSFNPTVITIKTGGVFRSGTTTNYWYNNTTTANAVVIRDGGEYWASHGAELLPPNGGITQESGSRMRFSYGNVILPPSLPSYYNLIFSGTGTRKPGGNVTILESLELSGSVTLYDSTFVYSYAPAAVLRYGGDGFAEPQITTDTEWPVSNGPANVEINNPAGVTLHAPRTISGTLKLVTGCFDIGAYNLKTGNTSGASADSWVVTSSTGMLAANVGGTVLFPVGTASSYLPVQFTGNNAGHDIMVRVSSSISNPLADGTRAVGLEWHFTEAVPGNNTGSLTLQWNTVNNGPGFNPAEPVSIGVWNGTSYDLTDATVSGSDPLSVAYVLPSVLPAGPFVVGNKDAFPTTDIYVPATGGLSIYPNPVGDHLVLGIEGVDNQLVEIYSMTGTRVKTLSLSPVSALMNVSDLPGGMYIVRTTGQGGPVAGKFIKK